MRGRWALGLAALAVLAVAPSAPAAPGADPCAEAAAPAWKAIEDRGGVVPDIEDDGTQAPPLWWRYPGAKRAAALFAAEARDAATGLYSAISPAELDVGDVVVRTAGAGACGALAVVSGKVEGHWVLDSATAKATEGTLPPGDDVFFVDGQAPRPETAIYRIRVKADSSQGHARELDRDLTHLERVIAERPPLVAKGARGAVDAKVHELVDEASSLKHDPDLDVERRDLTGRALALAAALDWPGAAESAAAVLDDAITHAPAHAAPIVARASVALLMGDASRAAALVEPVAARPDAPPRASYVLARALLAAGKTDAGLAALRRYALVEPRDARAGRLVDSGGKTPTLAPAPPPAADARFEADLDRVRFSSARAGLRIDWPLSWRVLAVVPARPGELLVQLVTDRAFDDRGDTDRGAVTVLVTRAAPDSSSDALSQVTGGELKGKPLPPLIPDSRRRLARFKAPTGELRVDEATTLTRSGTTCVLELDASARIYPKLRDELAGFVKSLTFAPPPTPKP